MPELLALWVKAPILKNADIIIVSKCLKHVNPELYGKITKGKVVLEYCPEQENPESYGKIASIIRSSKPRSLTVVTIDGSPHCFILQAAVNEAAYILGEKVVRKHFVVLDGKELVEITPEAIRVARYLSLVNSLIKRNPYILKELKKHSYEYNLALETNDAEIKE
ncbi:MAG: 4Fe-4S ferredoxin [Candidatus Njordarchaeales archaeon]